MAFQLPVIWKCAGKEDVIYNFRHKNIYLSYGEPRAVTYAVNTEFGSEILTRIISLYRLLRGRIGYVKIPSNIDIIDLVKVENQKHVPVLIGIDDINLADLQTEHGEPADRLLTQIELMKLLLPHELFWNEVQFYNFELLRPIHPSKLSYYKINCSGDIGHSSFKWNLDKLLW